MWDATWSGPFEVMSSAVLFEQGVQAFRERRWEHAIELLSQVASDDPADEDAEAMLEAAIAEQGRADAGGGAPGRGDGRRTVSIPIWFPPIVPQQVKPAADRAGNRATIDLSAPRRPAVDGDPSPPR